MDIEPTVLIIYAIIWTIFYFFLSNYIAELSRKKWTAWVVSDDSDDVLLDALSVIVDEIEDRMHDKLEHFQSLCRYQRLWCRSCRIHRQGNL